MSKNTKYHNSKLYFIHGYQSSPNGDKAKLFREKLNATPITYRTCRPEDIVISDCVNRIADILKYDSNITLIGSSLGGFLSAAVSLQNISVKKLILLNPAVIPPSTNFDQKTDVPKKIFEDMRNSHLFENKIDASITILRGINDVVVPNNWIIEFAMAQEAVVHFFHDDHRLSRLLPNLPRIVSEILNQ
jgi:predicted esterase YcpF (UPF0227 family)